MIIFFCVQKVFRMCYCLHKVNINSYRIKVIVVQAMLNHLLTCNTSFGI